MNYTSNLAYNLSDDDFETLMNCLCERMTGTETIFFAKGKDGGKDGRPLGFSTKGDLWRQNLIIQSKHVENTDTSCSDNTFYGNLTSVIAKEITRLKKLKKETAIKGYILFTNRKYTGNADNVIRKAISDEIGIDIDLIEIIGLETINNLLNDSKNKDLVSRFKLNQIQIPFEFSESDIKEIVITFKGQLDDITKDVEKKIEDIKFDYSKITMIEKNKKNSLSESYYNNSILKSSLQYFDKIDYFLGLEKNDEVKEIYYDIVTELNNIITLKREDFGQFEEIFNYIYNIIKVDPDYRAKKKFIWIVLHYMYFTCSIGNK